MYACDSKYKNQESFILYTWSIIEKLLSATKKNHFRPKPNLITTIYRVTQCMLSIPSYVRQAICNFNYRPVMPNLHYLSSKIVQLKLPRSTSVHFRLMSLGTTSCYFLGRLRKFA